MQISDNTQLLILHKGMARTCDQQGWQGAHCRQRIQHLSLAHALCVAHSLHQGCIPALHVQGRLVQLQHFTSDFVLVVPGAPG